MLGRGEGLAVGSGEELGDGEDDGDGNGEVLGLGEGEIEGLGKGLGAVVIKTLICSTGWPSTVCWLCSTVTIVPAETAIVRIMLAVVMIILVTAIQLAMQSSDQQ